MVGLRETAGEGLCHRLPAEPHAGFEPATPRSGSERKPGPMLTRQSRQAPLDGLQFGLGLDFIRKNLECFTIDNGICYTLGFVLFFLFATVLGIY